MFNDTWRASNATSNGRNFTTIHKTDDDDSFTGAEVTAMQLCHGFLGAVGFLENVGVILVILFNRIMLDFPANWFVLSLAISDAVACIVTVLVININTIRGQNVEILTVLFRFLVLSGCGNLFILTLNRFLSLYNSLRYAARMTTRRAKLIVWVPWVTSFILCAFEAYSNWVKRKKTFVGGPYYSALILSITAMNMYMFKQARQKSKEIKPLESAVLGPKATSSMREYRLVIRLLIVTFTFFISCIPLMVIWLVYQTELGTASTSFQ
jgi:hypothetical protein